MGWGREFIDLIDSLVELDVPLPFPPPFPFPTACQLAVDNEFVQLGFKGKQ